MTGKESILSIECNGSNGALDRIIVDLNSFILQEQAEALQYLEMYLGGKRSERFIFLLLHIEVSRVGSHKLTIPKYIFENNYSAATQFEGISFFLRNV